MVYTEAVILETLRISSVAAVGIPHIALDDARIGNYIIPKVFITIVLNQVYCWLQSEGNPIPASG